MSGILEGMSADYSNTFTTTGDKAVEAANPAAEKAAADAPEMIINVDLTHRDGETVFERYARLDKQKSQVKRFFDELNRVTEAVAELNGVGTYFQDAEGTVYKVDKQEGKFVHFEPFCIKRTRREGETKGDLSMKEAEEAGFKLPDSIRKKK